MPLREYTRALFDAYEKVRKQIQLDSVIGFERLFESHRPAAGAEGYEFIRIESAASFDRICRAKGLYLIASDFMPDLDKRDGCSLQIDELPVIYRGQADLVRERVQSHLDNTRYRKLKTDKNEGIWKRCLKLDRNPGDGGIDFDAAPYRDHRWVVLVLPLRDSKTEFRDYAEWGFDAVFGRPIASNERAVGPSNSALDEARDKLARLPVG